MAVPTQIVQAGVSVMQAAEELQAKIKRGASQSVLESIYLPVLERRVKELDKLTSQIWYGMSRADVRKSQDVVAQSHVILQYLREQMAK